MTEQTDTTNPENNAVSSALQFSLRGVEVIRDRLTTLPHGPGVYRMLNATGEALYVGKARSLRRRVTNYTQVARLPYRLQRMVAETVDLEVVTTHTEAEALLLESNLIKRLAPRYNVLLRDDKSFPYILITGHLNRQYAKTGADPNTHKASATLKTRRRSRTGPDPADWPSVIKYRGARTLPGDYFGPFASAGAVNRTLNTLERAFLLRSCSDAVFSNRSRPCLKHQLHRCAAPCVGEVSTEDYNILLDQARSFLTGRSREVQEEMAAKMQDASKKMEFEAAARFRDRIRAMTQIQSNQDINIENLDVREADIVAAEQNVGRTCIQVFFFRNGRNYGNRAYFPHHDKSVPLADVLGAFLGQFYENKQAPSAILLSHKPTGVELIAEALSVQARHKVSITVPQRGAKRKLVEHARTNAHEALRRRLAESATNRSLLNGVAELFGLDAPPQRIEVYDNSHISGAYATGAMIVAGPDGFIKSAYRRFNIKGAASGKDADDGYARGDDYAMMREVLHRRFARALKKDLERRSSQWPDLILVDGGKGQLSATRDVMQELGIEDVPTVAIAKGLDRDAGRERFFVADGDPDGFQLHHDDPVLYYLQRLRDESHRFVIGTHRQKRSKAISRNPLDEVPGIGTKRKRALLHHFGSARSVARAGVQDLERVDGISDTVARRIYDFFNSNS
ncbi:MAG: excinuclease ABC subunit C [Alphaproteobacteria bacterium]|nr:excinuclease ABC subunit C [Alphaproteobacteria bacterium]